MSTDLLKTRLRDAGVTVHRDMDGPAASFNGHAVTAVTRRLADEELITELSKIAPVNFSFYTRVGESVRYAIWKAGTC